MALHCHIISMYYIQDIYDIIMNNCWQLKAHKIPLLDTKYTLISGLSRKHTQNFMTKHKIQTKFAD